MDEQKKAPAGLGGRGYITERVFSHGREERKRRVIRPCPASPRKCDGRKKWDKR